MNKFCALFLAHLCWYNVIVKIKGGRFTWQKQNQATSGLAWVHTKEEIK